MATAVLSKPQPRPFKLSRERFYRPELDALRFFAFFGVFIWHTLSSDVSYYVAHHLTFAKLAAAFVGAGRFGVDLFFFLSAYLITELLLREKEQFGVMDLRSFYLRRILRIWPLYFLAILIAIFLSHIDPTQTFPLTYALAFVLLSGNWLISLRLAGILRIADTASVMVILWSVSFEEQFYLLWPAFLARARRQTILTASGVLFIISALSRMVLLRYDHHSETAIFTNSLARLDPLALGIVTAVLLHDRKIRLRWFVRLGLFTSGFATLIAAGYYFHLTRGFMLFGYPAVAAGVSLVFLSVYQIRFVPRQLRYLGKISYSLYIFHMLALYLSLKVLGVPHNLRSFLYYWGFGLTITLLLAAFSYYFIESPFLRLKERFARIKSRPV